MTTAPATPGRIDIGAILTKVFDTYGKTFAVLIPAALIVYTPVAFVAALLNDSAAGGLVASLLGLVASAWYAGMVVRTVQDVQDGQVDASIGELFRSVTGVILPLILVGFVVGICVVVGLVLFIVPGLIILTIWSVASPVVVVENPGVFAALGRSRALVRGNGWQVFGVIVAIFAIILVVSIVIGSIGAIGDSFLLFFLVQLLLNVALAPIYALAAAVLYFALRGAHGQPVGIDPATGGFAPPQAPAAPAPATPAPVAPPAPAPPAPPATGTDAFGNPIPPPAPPSAPPPGTPPAQ
jgi:hypothetical protein